MSVNEIEAVVSAEDVEAATRIIEWYKNGYMSYRERGLEEPKIVEEAIKEYRSDNDLIGQFLEEKCERGSGKKTHRIEMVTKGILFPKMVAETTRTNQSDGNKTITSSTTKGIFFWRKVDEKDKSLSVNNANFSESDYCSGHM